MGSSRGSSINTRGSWRLWSLAGEVAAGEDRDSGKPRKGCQGDHDGCGARSERLGGHESDVRERGEFDEPVGDAEQRADEIPEERDA